MGLHVQCFSLGWSFMLWFGFSCGTDKTISYSTMSSVFHIVLKAVWQKELPSWMPSQWENYVLKCHDSAADFNLWWWIWQRRNWERSSSLYRSQSLKPLWTISLVFNHNRTPSTDHMETSLLIQQEIVFPVSNIQHYLVFLRSNNFPYIEELLKCEKGPITISYYCISACAAALSPSLHCLKRYSEETSLGVNREASNSGTVSHPISRIFQRLQQKYERADGAVSVRKGGFGDIILAGQQPKMIPLILSSLVFFR